MRDAVLLKSWWKGNDFCCFAGAKLTTICCARTFSASFVSLRGRSFHPGLSSPAGWLRFAPFQLAAQNLKIRFPWRLDELQQLFRTGDADKIRGVQWDTALSVERQKNGLRVPGEFQLDGRRVADYKWAITQRVRADGRDHEGFHRGMHDGSAGGEGIGGRACGAGHDQAVGAVATDKIAVNRELKTDHAGERALIDHHLVQYAVAIDHFACAFELDADHDAFAQRIMALQGVIERRGA